MNDTEKPEPLQRTDKEWVQQLDKQQYHVLRGEGTERPFSSELLAASPIFASSRPPGPPC